MSHVVIVLSDMHSGEAERAAGFKILRSRWSKHDRLNTTAQFSHQRGIWAGFSYHTKSTRTPGRNELLSPAATSSFCLTMFCCLWQLALHLKWFKNILHIHNINNINIILLKKSGNSYWSLNEMQMQVLHSSVSSCRCEGLNPEGKKRRRKKRRLVFFLFCTCFQDTVHWPFLSITQLYLPRWLRHEIRRW